MTEKEYYFITTMLKNAIQCMKDGRDELLIVYREEIKSFDKEMILDGINDLEDSSNKKKQFIDLFNNYSGGNYESIKEM